MNQAGIVDMNLNPSRGFALPSEAGRPVYVDPSAIVPTTGTMAIANSRRSAAFQSVATNRSDLHSASTQFVVKLVPVTTNKYLHWDFTYSLLDVRDQFYGFSGAGSTAGNPFDRQWGAHTAEGKHQFIVDWNSIPVADLFYVSVNTTVQIGHAVHADDRRRHQRRRLPERSRVRVRSRAHRPTRRSRRAMRSLLASGAPAARACLGEATAAARVARDVSGAVGDHRQPEHQLSIRRRCGCRSARTSSSPSPIPLAIADLIAHGNANTHGWGQDIPPDQNLLFVRGFDPATKQFKYAVNERFGSTRPQQSASRSAAFVSLNVSYDIGFTRERQMLTQRLDAGRDRPGTKQTAQTLKAFGTSSIPNPMSMILQQSDSLQLTRKQADSLATLSTKFSRYADSVWTPAAKSLEADAGAATTMATRTTQYVVAREQTMDYLIGIAPDLRGLLTADQKRKLPVDHSELPRRSRAQVPALVERR